jgi:hypothetical protein
MRANIVFPDRPRTITYGRPPFEALDLAGTIRRTGLGFRPKDEGAAAGESIWAAECLSPIGDDLAEDSIDRPQ